MAASLPDYMRMVSGGDLEFCAALAEMTAAEVAAKEARVTRQRIRSAGFPYEKTLADFDWSFQPSVPRARAEELATLRFMERAENVLPVGSPGVGKTHLAIAVGIEAVRARREVRFMDCARLVDDLRDAQSRGILKKRLQYYAHSKLLIIDELGYLDIDEGGADLLFQLVSTRYEQRSTIITTNVGIDGWAKVFGDEVAASAIADRACHHCHVIKITGRSYRLKDLPADSKAPPGGRREGAAMRVSDALEWLSALDGDAELAVTAAFPELDGWEVTSWALRPGEAEAGPCIGIDVFGADFDYPGPERALAREARAFLERLEGGAESGGNTLA